MKVKTGKFTKIPKVQIDTISQRANEWGQEIMNYAFSNMLGYTYKIELELNKQENKQEYLIIEGTTKEAEKEYEESKYKWLVKSGLDKEYARDIVTGKAKMDSTMSFDKECFENIQEVEENDELNEEEEDEL